MFIPLSLFQIVIDLGGMQEFLQKPVSEIYYDIFRYGGWIPFAWVFWKGFSELWLLSRSEKYAKTLQYVLLSVSIPRLSEQSPKAMEHVFTHLAGTYSAPNFKEKWWMGKFTPPFSFEFACVDGYTQFLIRAPVAHRDLVEAAIFSQFAEAEITEVADYTQNVPRSYPDPEWDCWGTEFVLSKPSAYPIRTWMEFEHSLSQELKDPLSSLLEAMSKMRVGEQVWLQILVYPRDQDWAKEGLDLVKKLLGKEPKKPVPMWAQAVHAGTGVAEGVLKELFSGGGGEHDKKPDKPDDKLKMLAMTPGERRVIEGMETKLSKIGFGAKFRFVYVAKRPVFRKGPAISLIRGAIGLFGSLDGNGFKGYGPVTPKNDYFWQRWSEQEKKTKIVRNYANRSANGAPRYVLNVEELASLYHYPAVLVKAPMIRKVESKKVEPPFTLPMA